MTATGSLICWGALLVIGYLLGVLRGNGWSNSVKPTKPADVVVEALHASALAEEQIDAETLQTTRTAIADKLGRRYLRTSEAVNNNILEIDGLRFCGTKSWRDSAWRYSLHVKFPEDIPDGWSAWIQITSLADLGNEIKKRHKDAT